MAVLLRDNTIDLEEKFRLMQEDARFDVLSGAEAETMDLAPVRQAIHSRRALPKVPKIFLSNECAFNCAYCNCRSGNDCKQTYLTSPRELAEFSVQVANRFGGGIFISSAIFRSADYTGELITETLRIIREEHRYTGYLHAKVMPGTSLDIIRGAGRYADRLSVNIEVAKSEGYSQIAVNKTKRNILTPMGYISDLIGQAKVERRWGTARFATSQTTQLMAGSTGESDVTILKLAQALYRKYNLSRVYYTAFQLTGQAAGYGDLPAVQTPSWRVSRLYQADMLIRSYGFRAEDLAPSSCENLRQDLDPKAAWALRNLHRFPIEVNTADIGELLQIPGIGEIGAKRILEARRHCTITHDTLRQLGISPKRSRHFLTCGGKYSGAGCEDSTVLYRLLADVPEGQAAGQLYFDLGATDPVHRMGGLRPLHA